MDQAEAHTTYYGTGIPIVKRKRDDKLPDSQYVIA